MCPVLLLVLPNITGYSTYTVQVTHNVKSSQNGHLHVCHGNRIVWSCAWPWWPRRFPPLRMNTYMSAMGTVSCGPAHGRDDQGDFPLSEWTLTCLPWEPYRVVLRMAVMTKEISPSQKNTYMSAMGTVSCGPAHGRDDQGDFPLSEWTLTCLPWEPYRVVLRMAVMTKEISPSQNEHLHVCHGNRIVWSCAWPWWPRRFPPLRMNTYMSAMGTVSCGPAHGRDDQGDFPLSEWTLTCLPWEPYRVVLRMAVMTKEISPSQNEHLHVCHGNRIVWSCAWPWWPRRFPPLRMNTYMSAMGTVSCGPAHGRDDQGDFPLSEWTLTCLPWEPYRVVLRMAVMTKEISPSQNEHLHVCHGNRIVWSCAWPWWPRRFPPLRMNTYMSAMGTVSCGPAHGRDDQGDFPLSEWTLTCLPWEPYRVVLRMAVMTKEISPSQNEHLHVCHGNRIVWSCAWPWWPRRFPPLRMNTYMSAMGTVSCGPAHGRDDQGDFPLSEWTLTCLPWEPYRVVLRMAVMTKEISPSQNEHLHVCHGNRIVWSCAWPWWPRRFPPLRMNTYMSAMGTVSCGPAHGRDDQGDFPLSEWTLTCLPWEPYRVVLRMAVMTKEISPSQNEHLHVCHGNRIVWSCAWPWWPRRFLPGWCTRHWVEPWLDSGAHSPSCPKKQYKKKELWFWIGRMQLARMSHDPSFSLPSLNLFKFSVAFCPQRPQGLLALPPLVLGTGSSGWPPWL